MKLEQTSRVNSLAFMNCFTLHLTIHCQAVRKHSLQHTFLHNNYGEVKTIRKLSYVFFLRHSLGHIVMFGEMRGIKLWKQSSFLLP